MRMLPPRSRQVFLLGLLLVAAGACGDERRGITAPPPGPTSLISDGSRAGGNPNFFFLPPLVANPSRDPDYSAGQFVATWKPTVQICRLVTATECESSGGAPVWHSYSGSAITVSTTDELYKFNWDTREAWAVAGQTYRARVVLIGNRTVELGFADIVLRADHETIESVATGEVIQLSDGRTVPIKFRIERGASVAPTSTDFTEVVVTPAGGAFATNTGDAGIFFDPNVYGNQSFTLTIQRVPVTGSTQCHGTATVLPWQQHREGCYLIETYPSIGILQANAVVGICNVLPTYEPQAIYKSDPLPAGGRRIKALENVPLPPDLAAMLTCEDFAATPVLARADDGIGDRLGRGARWLLAGVGRMIAPPSAYAIDFGVGGQLRVGTDDLSFFDWGVPVSVAENSGAGQSAALGDTTPNGFVVRVFGTHMHLSDTTWVSGVPVTFTVADGAFAALGAPTSLTVTSDADGYAAAPRWVLPAIAGDYTLTATIPDDSSNNPTVFAQARTVTFTATATAAPVLSIVVTDDGDVVTTDVLAMVVGASNTLLASSTPTALPCSWTSTNVSVAAVSPTGTITAIAAGTTNLVVSCGSVGTADYSPFVQRYFTLTVTQPPVPAVADIQLRRATGAVYPYSYINALVGTGNLFVAVPVDANGNAVQVACTWSDLESGAVDVYPSTQTPNAADVVGASPTDAAMTQIQVGCGGVSRQLYVSVAATNGIDNVDSIEVAVQGPNDLRPQPLASKAVLLANTAYAATSRPLDLSPLADLSSSVACGWYQSTGAIVLSPMVGNAITLTTTSGFSKLWVTCRGHTTEFDVSVP